MADYTLGNLPRLSSLRYGDSVEIEVTEGPATVTGKTPCCQITIRVAKADIAYAHRTGTHALIAVRDCAGCKQRYGISQPDFTNIFRLTLWRSPGKGWRGKE